MRIVNIVPGFGGSFYCGNCLRDSSYVKSLIDEGHDAITIPIYLPLSLDGEPKPDIPVFYGAVAIYMKQQFKFLRKMPKWLENFFNAPFMLRYAAKKAGSTRAEGLEEMTLSMLRGHEGYQKEELQQLIDFLKKEIKPDVVHLSNALLMGLAAKIKSDLGIPVVCSLQDEDVWIDAMNADYQDQLWGLFAEKARDIDAFVAVSRYYGEVMQKRMSIAPEKLHMIYIGLDVNNYDYAAPDTGNPVLGYMSRMNAENGFEVFMDAFIKLKSNPKYKNVKARVSGGQTGDDKKFVHKQLRKLKKNNLLDDVEFVEEYEEKYHNRYNQHIDLLSVPVLKGEAFGLYQIEALACGVPTVQPALGAFPEIAEVSQGGLIYEPNTPEVLARKWEELLADPGEMFKLSEHGRKSVEEIFNTKRTTRKILEVYQSVVLKNKSHD